MTEKQGGTDIGRTETQATCHGTHWTLRGHKWFCSNVSADLILTLARVPGQGSGSRGLGMFLVPRVRPDGTPNSLRIDRLKNKLGTKSMASGEVTLEDAYARSVGDLTRGFLQMVRGGNGYIEDWVNPRLLRDAHLGSIWEGSSNVIALDVLRCMSKEQAHHTVAGAYSQRLNALSNPAAKPAVQDLDVPPVSPGHGPDQGSVQSSPDSPAPLQGIRVVDLSKILAGPYVTMTLADLGAEVVKVEHPDGGDPTRRWGPPFNGPDATYYLSTNRNKKSVTIDLKSPEGRDAVNRLVAKADIVVENFRRSWPCTSTGRPVTSRPANAPAGSVPATPIWCRTRHTRRLTATLSSPSATRTCGRNSAMPSGGRNWPKTQGSGSIRTV